MPELREIGIEEVLERHLGAVSAPADLWTRLQNRRTRTQGARPVSKRLAWALAAAALVGGASWMLHPRPEIRSTDAREIREWVKARTDLDVPLRAGAPLIGAHVTRFHDVEIAYRASGHDGILTVAKAPGAANTHASGEKASWTMRGESYAVACDDPHAACVLCHS